MTLRRFPGLWVFPVAIAGFFACLSENAGRLAGTSVTTGNPSEIELGFVHEGSPAQVTGHIDLFAATQIPVPGFSPDPLARFPLENDSGFRLKPDVLRSVPDTSWPTSSVAGDSVFRFHLVVDGGDKGAIVRGLVFRRGGELSWEGVEGGEPGASESNGVLEVVVAPMVEFQVFLAPHTLESVKEHFLFLYGTGYAAKSDSGNFVFPGLPAGNHEASYLSLYKEESRPFHPQDSVNIHALDRPIEAEGQRARKVTDILETVPLPDAYKTTP